VEAGGKGAGEYGGAGERGHGVVEVGGP